ncbi:MAG: UPF0182 family protein [Chthonomonadales bacterium]
MQDVIKVKKKVRPIVVIRWVFVLTILAFFFLASPVSKIYTDWQWFTEVGHTEVFKTKFMSQWTLFAGFSILFFVIVGGNVLFAQAMNRAHPKTMKVATNIPNLTPEMIAKAEKFVSRTILVFVGVVSLMVGLAAATEWKAWLLFSHAEHFGTKDPVFGNDIGFYIFRLPFAEWLQGQLMFVVIASVIASILVYAGHRATEFASGGFPSVDAHVRKHLLVLASMLFLTFAWGLNQGRYSMLTDDNGVFFGAGYTDLHARLPLMNFNVILMFVLAGLCLNAMRTAKGCRVPIGSSVIVILINLLVGGVYPGVVQRFTVVPNQYGMEQQYIEDDLKFTRAAYGLDHVRVKDLGGAQTVSGEELTANKATVENIRLWDWPQLGSVYSNRQAVRPYYRFRAFGSEEFNIDIDRYKLNGVQTQVMLAARELYAAGLPPQAQTWQNKRLQYTHGYGAVMSPVNKVDSQGLPTYLVSQVPVQSNSKDIAITRPEIYFGEMQDEYAFVDSRQKEFDYPDESGNRETKYTGTGGIKLGGMLSRLMWSTHLHDTNMLLSSDLTDGSRILYRRNIRQRVQSLAPFLTLDNDPYLVIDGGKMVYMLDGYTTSDRYPYSKPTEGGIGQRSMDINYIRNSVKAVVDTYNGSVQLYISDPNDPIVKAWSRIYPTLMKPLKEMPASLRAHMRYPEDLFKVQRDIYTTYHMPDARTYYGKEDAWQVPIDPITQVDSQGNKAEGRDGGRMVPYYIQMRLPDESKDEFIMMSPFSPLSKDNLAAWMCAKCDESDYGNLTVYRFPKGSNINGPRQVMSLVRKQDEISRFMTLLGQQGSQVIFGNLLVIPVGSGLLYVTPVYVQATNSGGSALPGLSQVVVCTGDRVVMRPTLDEAIAVLGGQAKPNVDEETVDVGHPALKIPVNATVPTNLKPATQQEIIKKLNTIYKKARAKQKEYNDSLDELGKTLNELQGKVSP